MLCSALGLTYLMLLVHYVDSCQNQENNIGCSEVGATISTRDCETRLSVSEIENREAYDTTRLC